MQASKSTVVDLRFLPPAYETLREGRGLLVGRAEPQRMLRIGAIDMEILIRLLDFGRLGNLSARLFYRPLENALTNRS